MFSKGLSPNLSQGEGYQLVFKKCPVDNQSVWFDSKCITTFKPSTKGFIPSQELSNCQFPITLLALCLVTDFDLNCI